MEVHHHSHAGPDMHKGHRKKWTHYFWEFLMLFLAVFCGFMAENQREHYVEHQREKQFIKSLVQDLKSDIEQIDKTMLRLEATKKAMDTIIVLISTPGFEQNTNDAYRLWSRNIGYADFFSNDRTIQQLKNSGALRLIRKRNVSDSIMQYDRVLRDYYGQDELMSRVLADQSPYTNLFDFVSLDNNQDNSPVPLTQMGKDQLSRSYAHCKLWRFGLNGLIKRLKVVGETANRTLELIKEEYRVK